MTGLAAIGRRNGCDQCIALTTTDRVDVTEGQAKVDDERDQRKPRTERNIVPKPTHPQLNRPNLLVTK
jgi:hypothetical protein